MSEKFKVIITPEAQDDIRNSIMYIAHELANRQAAIALQIDAMKGSSSLSGAGLFINRVYAHRNHAL